MATAVGRTLGLKEEAAVPMREVVGRYSPSASSARAGQLSMSRRGDRRGGLAGRGSAPALPRHEPYVLHLTGEQEFGVPPLGVPRSRRSGGRHVGGGQLFIERAGAGTGFETDEQALRDVARICRRLDGLPLALELAAARTKALPVAVIRSRLDQSLELLTLAARDVPERHRSLHAAVTWSYGLLTPADRAFFRRLSVFRGGWSLDAAAAVTLASRELGSDVLDLTTSLLDESLIRRQPEARTEARYDMLETLREYGRERLAEADEADETAERHAAWYLELAERAAP
jgi:predicted ATPase